VDRGRKTCTPALNCYREGGGQICFSSASNRILDGEGGGVEIGVCMELAVFQKKVYITKNSLEVLYS